MRVSSYSLFLDSGIQYLTYELPKDISKAIKNMPGEARVKILGVWSHDPVEGHPWLKWRLTRRERADDPGEYYELMLAVDTSAGQREDGFIAESERQLPDRPFRFRLELSGKEAKLVPASAEGKGFVATIELITSQFGGEKINVALVLDVGNSRTLGILVDEEADMLSLKENVVPFVLRGKEDPARGESVFSTDLELAASPLAPLKYPVRHPRVAAGEKDEVAAQDNGGPKIWKVVKPWKRGRDTKPAPEVLHATPGAVESKHPKPFCRDISFVRLGEEADLLQGRAQDIDDNAVTQGFTTGMSSPKRYLWDNEPTDSAWFMHGPVQSQPGAKWWRQLGNQRILGYFTDEDTDWPSGDQVREILEETEGGLSPSTIARKHKIDERTYRHWREVFKDQHQFARHVGPRVIMPTRWPVMGQPPEAPDRARYPRRTAMVWLLFDLLVRAWEQINSPEFRNRARHANRRRRLSDIVITFPACMPPEEKRRYHEQARKALGILLEEILPDQERTPPPRLHWEWDEARSVHMVFLYAATRAAGLDGKQFFRMFARPSQSGERQVRLTSLDIGGGTLDLAVIDYAHTADVGVALKPTLVYQDGLRVGGDDVIYELINEYVLPRLADHVGLNSQSLGAIINCRGGGAWTNSVQEAAYWRRRWMRSLWVPLATKLIEYMAASNGDSVKGGGLLCRNVCGRDFRALEKLSRAAERCNTTFKKPPEDCRFPIELDTLNEIVSKTFEMDLRSLCGAAIEYSSDFVIVSGRITAVPAVRRLIMSYLPMPPQRIVFLHGYPVGEWYPLVFQDVDGQIKDAKSAVAVGATIGLLASKLKLQFFNVMPFDQRPDPGYFWGVGTRVDHHIDTNNPLFKPTQGEHETNASQLASGSALIHRKRDRAAETEGEPIYEVRLREGIERVTITPTFTFRLHMAEDGMLTPQLDDVTGAFNDGTEDHELALEDVIFRFMTLDKDRYFLDSGEVRGGGARL